MFNYHRQRHHRFPTPSRMAAEIFDDSRFSCKRLSGNPRAVMARFDNPKGILRIGMTAEVRILLDQASDVLTIPATALGARAEASVRGDRDVLR